jgi:hypothetical protein
MEKHRIRKADGGMVAVTPFYYLLFKEQKE